MFGVQTNFLVFVFVGCRVCFVGIDSSGVGEEVGGKEQYIDFGRQLVSEGFFGFQELIWFRFGFRDEIFKYQGN